MRIGEMDQLLRDEIVQRREEGCDVEKFRPKLEEALQTRSSQRLDAIYEELVALRPSSTYPYREPSSLEEIRREMPPSKKGLGGVSEVELADRLLGAWLGRCAGCLLGKPVEGWSREKIRSTLVSSNSYPLGGYMQGNVRGMERDDDMDYTILGLHVLESHGVNFTTEDVADEWLSHLPFGQVYTAEKVAYRNLVNGLRPPVTATFLNPYREWIGAQIRADIWGYVTPGRPQRGAELAHRDARLSHVKNGIYGEMFIAAALSTALVSHDIQEVLQFALSAVPSNSRLAQAVRDVLTWGMRCDGWEDAWEEVMGKYGSYHPVHTINNLAFVLIGLLYGNKKLEDTIATSVMCGLDTDCNGATAGSIIGALLGAKNMPSKWTEPLSDSIESAVMGFTKSRISDLAGRTEKIAEAFART
jgi:ADP-ribosylglycohydrolase